MTYVISYRCTVRKLGDHFAVLESSTAAVTSFPLWDLVSLSWCCLANLSHSFLWYGQWIFWQSLPQYWTDLQLEHLLDTFSWPHAAQALSSWKPRWPLMHEPRMLTASTESPSCLVFDRFTSSWRNSVVSLKGNVRIASLTKLSMYSGKPSDARGRTMPFAYWFIKSATGLSGCCSRSFANLSTRKRR